MEVAFEIEVVSRTLVAAPFALGVSGVMVALFAVSYIARSHHVRELPDLRQAAAELAAAEPRR